MAPSLTMDSRLIEKTPSTMVTARTAAKAVMTLLRIDKFWNQLIILLLQCGLGGEAIGAALDRSFSASRRIVSACVGVRPRGGFLGLL